MTKNYIITFFIIVIATNIVQNQAFLIIKTNLASSTVYPHRQQVQSFQNAYNCLHIRPTSTSSLSTASASFNSININDNNTLNPYYERLIQPVKLGPHLNIKGRVLNLWGVLYALTTFAVAMAVIPFMVISAGVINLFGNPKQRRFLDWIVHFWAGLAMRLSFCFPQVYGLENLPPSNETVVYVPNHTSFVDILLFSGFVPRPFKYLSKAEILKIPVIGLGMKLAMHVFLARGDLRSTLDATELCSQRLRDGNSMVLFAEGTRSADGRLQTFKKGAFQIAKAAGVRIVPVSIGNLHRLMPKQAILPIAPLRHAYIKIHPPIETANRTISEIRSQCHEAVNFGLPPYQQHQKTSRLPAAVDAE